MRFYIKKSLLIFLLILIGLGFSGCFNSTIPTERNIYFVFGNMSPRSIMGGDGIASFSDINVNGVPYPPFLQNDNGTYEYDYRGDITIEITLKPENGDAFLLTGSAKGVVSGVVAFGKYTLSAEAYFQNDDYPNRFLYAVSMPLDGDIEKSNEIEVTQNGKNIFPVILFANFGFGNGTVGEFLITMEMFDLQEIEGGTIYYYNSHVNYNSNYPQTITLSLSEDSDIEYTEVKWIYDSENVNKNSIKVSTNEEEDADFVFSQYGTHTINLSVEADSIPYSKSIKIMVDIYNEE